MFLVTFLCTLLLAGLLIWYKSYFLDENNSKKRPLLNKYQDVILILIVSSVFVIIQTIIEYKLSSNQTSATRLNNSASLITRNQSYLNPEQQYKIGKAFYLGDGLPKDNTQALNWLLLASQQGHKEAGELIHLFGYKVQNNEVTEAATEESSTLAVDIIAPDKIKTKLDDIAGLTEAKNDARKFIEFIKNPKKYQKLGAIPPKGLILYGPPGTGKTMLARAIAGETNATFISVAGSAFEEVYVGKGAARVRELFELARQHKPALIFIDEIDALASSRKSEDISSGQIQTVNQLLSEMQNLNEENNAEIYVLAATNRLEALDAALLRPGRFDWQLEIRLPSDQDRNEILKKLLTKISAAKDIDLALLVEKTAGYSGAELANLVNEAAINAGETEQTNVNMKSFDTAFAKLANNVRDPNPSLSVTIVSPHQLKTRFSDVAGMNEAKNEVIEVIDFLKNPQKFSRLGAKPPNGVLIYGPPGTGKTLMARAMAGEANATLLAVSGSDFDERYVGVGASRIRELFKVARKYQPCIVFIDEIDSLAPKRSKEDHNGNEQTLNQLLNEMDNINNTKNQGIIFIGATNRLDIIDPALLRPGRFDRKVYFRLPNILERQQILQQYLDKIQYGPDVKVAQLAQTSQGYSGADLANLVNEAAIIATRANKNKVDMASFEEASDKILLGLNQGSSSYSDQERKLTAYHEAGHALVGLLDPNHPRVFHKVSISLRDETLGTTHFRYESEKLSLSKKEFESLIATSLGGLIAEQLIFGKENATDGAASDLTYANEVAKAMVTKYGMADDGTLIVTDVLGDDGSDIKNANIILERDYAVAKKILEDNLPKLHLLAKELLEKETLNYDQIIKLLNITPAKASKS